MANLDHPSSSRLKVLRGANLALYTLIGIAIAVAVNYYASRYTRQWDLTPNQKYSLSAQSRKILKTLNTNVTLYVFDQAQHFRARRDLLEQYAAATPRVKVEYIDPNRDPGLAKQFGVHSYGTVIVAAGSRHDEAKTTTEEGITNALISVLKGPSVVYFAEGHGERDPNGSDAHGYSNVKTALENENDQVKTVNLLAKPEIPADCALLIIAGPQKDYLPQEVDAIKKYLAGGGRVLFMLDPGVSLPNLTGLLASYNVTARNDLVIDQNPIAQMFGTTPSMPLIMKYGTSPIVEPLQRFTTLFPLTRSFEVGKTPKPDVTVESLCETTPESFDVANFNPSMREVSYRPGKDLKGPLTVAVSGQLTNSADSKPEGRFVALGTSLLAANAYLGFQANRDLFMNIVDWLSSNENLISIRPKPPEQQHLNLTARQMTGLLIKVAAVPLLILIAGILVWWSRR
jgi:ABC-type uncharacterized transport system involved in gliding motility auxiliary subunit